MPKRLGIGWIGKSAKSDELDVHNSDRLA
jgi:hypothetical protein